MKQWSLSAAAIDAPANSYSTPARKRSFVPSPALRATLERGPSAPITYRAVPRPSSAKPLRWRCMPVKAVPSSSVAPARSAAAASQRMTFGVSVARK